MSGSIFYNNNPQWGIGSITDEKGEVISYGYPWQGLDPARFHPDYEVCTKQEIENYRASLNQCENENKDDTNKGENKP